MRFLHAVAGFVLFFELPIPIYWLILHPFNSFWRSRVRAAFWFAGLTAWTCGGVLWSFRHVLLAATRPSWFAIAAGFTLIAVEGYLFVRVERRTRQPKARRPRGTYRHGRNVFRQGYTRTCATRAMRECSARFLALGCLLEHRCFGSSWRFGGPFALIVIRLEEKELAARFGPAYEAYRKRVPAFLPFRMRASDKQ